MSNRRAELESLLSLITKATRDAMNEYEDASELPSLDLPAHLPPNDLALKRAIQVLEGACFQLCTTLAPPNLVMYRRSLEPVDSACLRVAINAKIADVLGNDSDGLHVRDIAERTGLEQGKLLKVLRNLAAKHCFRQVAPGTFTNNRLSYTLLDNSPTAALSSIMMEDMNKIAVSTFYDALIDPEYGHSYDPRRTAFGYGVRDEMPDTTLFEWLREHPAARERFHRGMMGMALVTDCQVVVDQFPWGSLPIGTTVCDVGSSVGIVMSHLVKQYPQIHVTLQDLPIVLDQARELWKVEHADVIRADRVEFVPFDFLTESPVPEQDIYFIRQVMHNWPNKDCITILRNIRNVMTKSSRVLIHEYVLQFSSVNDGSAHDIDAETDVAPRPLLASYGFGNSRAYMADVNMHILTNAGERTLDEFKELGNKAGLRFVKLWDLLETGLVEFALGDM